MRLVHAVVAQFKTWPSDVAFFTCDNDGEVRANGKADAITRWDFYPSEPVDECDRSPSFGPEEAPVGVGRSEWTACQVARVITLTPAEVSSGYDRVQRAEGLIRQLPEDHEGRNSWLMNYGDPVKRAADERLHKIRNALTAIDSKVAGYNVNLDCSVAMRATVEAMIDAGYRKP